MSKVAEKVKNVLVTNSSLQQLLCRTGLVPRKHGLRNAVSWSQTLTHFMCESLGPRG